jgi:opacity protein-like surface antigen
MKRTRVVTLLLSLLISITAFAQKAEVAIDYSLLVFYPAKNLTGARNFYGGGGSLVYNFRRHLGLKSEFEGYLSSTAKFTVAANPPTVPTGGTFESKGNMFTYLFGPQVSFPIAKSNTRIFGEALFGGAHTNLYGNFFKAAHITGVSTSNNSLAMAFGGGVDIGVGQHVAFRLVELDYVMTRYEWKVLGINNQSSVRYQGGIVFAWGE